MNAHGTNILIEIIQASDPVLRNRSLGTAASGASRDELLLMAESLHTFWRTNDNLYERVRALFLLSSLYRFHLAPLLSDAPHTYLPETGVDHLLKRRFVEAIDSFRIRQADEGISDNLCSALAQACRQLGLKFLADQVQRSVRSVRGNQWMFRCGHPAEYPLRLRSEMLKRDADGLVPILVEQTPVRMDLSHSCWSDIFFLGMDFPEGARVINVSVDLCLQGDAAGPVPPVSAWYRVINEPVIRLASVDLGASAVVDSLGKLFNFSMDYLGLLKAGLIASGIVPAGLEGSQAPLSTLLRRLVGEGRGLELVTSVNNIPKGSRLAVSTNLLAAMIAGGMRITGQTESLEGPLTPRERRLVAARAIQGEWLGGSGGGWQDSGGAWPGIKIIRGCPAKEGDPEFGVSRGTLLPAHQLLTREVPVEAREKLQESLLLVHGGMAQNVGPILEMVTEKYLLRGEAEWQARQQSLALFEEIVDDLKAGRIRELADKTTTHFFGPLQTIIPWISNAYTERLIEAARETWGERFWGFVMLGGMAGGGMGFFFDPEIKAEVRQKFPGIMQRLKDEYEQALPFAMDPVVYDFRVNEDGTTAEQRAGVALMPPGYYRLRLSEWMKGGSEVAGASAPGTASDGQDGHGRLSCDTSNLKHGRKPKRRTGPTSNPEFNVLREQAKARPELRAVFNELIGSDTDDEAASAARETDVQAFLAAHGFDKKQHEDIRRQLREGRIGLAQNRMPMTTRIEDETDVTRPGAATDSAVSLLRAGGVAVFTLAAGAASRWTEGAGVVKALHPFCRFGKRHRNFLEVHLAKSRAVGERVGRMPPHIFSTSYLTDPAIRNFVEAESRYPGTLMISPGSSIGLRLIPEPRDLRFAWEQTRHQELDERAQLQREQLQQTLMSWAEAQGPSNDYTDNQVEQCLHPVGHWFEFPNLLLNGTLARLLQAHPDVQVLLMHNIDTLGAYLDPAVLAAHLDSGARLSFEVIRRRIEDVGGGLARVDGRRRLVEGMALPREDDELKLTWYNTLTNWISIDPLLETFGLDRDSLDDAKEVADAVRRMAYRMPTMVTLKEVKRRWGAGQEDVYPVTQFEKLWGDMSANRDIDTQFIEVSRFRGQQLKQQAQLDDWVQEGGRAFVERLLQG